MARLNGIRPLSQLFVRRVARLTSRRNNSKRSGTLPPRRDIEHCLAHPPTLARQQQVNNLAAQLAAQLAWMQENPDAVWNAAPPIARHIERDVHA
jgi:hypothetical protein